MLAKGTTVAGYRIEGLLGQGGMGVVYEATQISLERTVALKLLDAQAYEDAEFRERFRREGLLQAAIDHPNIVAIYEAGETPEGLFLAMRLVRGPNLKDMILGRELDPGRALRLLSAVADALDSAHEAGLIHRDVKPANILVGAHDRAYLADFGLTKSPDGGLTLPGQILGTIDYISPEQLQEEPATARSDIYSLGAVLYESLTGAVPFPKESEAAVLFAHLSEPPPLVSERRPELPATLDQIIACAMAKEPEERYSSASEMLDEAELALGTAVSGVMGPPRPIAGPEDLGIHEPEERPADDRRFTRKSDGRRVEGTETSTVGDGAARTQEDTAAR